MGLDELSPYRVIFSPTLKDGVNQYDKEITKIDKIDYTNLEEANEILLSSGNYTEDTTGKINGIFEWITGSDVFEPAHTKVLKDENYINYIQSILPNYIEEEEEIVSDDIIETSNATVQIFNNTESKIWQLYIKDSENSDWGDDRLPNDLIINEGIRVDFSTIECDKYIDIKATTWLGIDVWEKESIYLECDTKYTFTLN